MPCLWNNTIEKMDLHELEESYRVCDMFFYYDEKFNNSLEYKHIMEEKSRIFNAIIEILDKNELPKRKCRKCGKPLAWNFRYSICDKCHRNISFPSMHARRYKDYCNFVNC